MELPWHYQGYTDFLIAILGTGIFCAIIIVWAMIDDARKNPTPKRTRR